MSLIVLYFLHSTSILLSYIDVVLTLSIIGLPTGELKLDVKRTYIALNLHLPDVQIRESVNALILHLIS